MGIYKAELDTFFFKEPGKQRHCGTKVVDELVLPRGFAHQPESFDSVDFDEVDDLIETVRSAKVITKKYLA